MSELDTLTFVRKMPPKARTERSGKTSLDRAKERFVNEISSQIELSKNAKFIIKRTVKKRGSKGTKTITRKPRTWVESVDGVSYITARISNKPFNLGGKRGAILSCADKDVAKTLGVLKKAVEGGEFDNAIEKAMAAAKRKPRK